MLLLKLYTDIVITESYYNVRHPPPPEFKRIPHKGIAEETLQQLKQSQQIRQTRQLDIDGHKQSIKSGTSRTTGPVFTIVKTDPKAHFRWGVRHFVGKKYA